MFAVYLMEHRSPPSTVVILGPTAVGKSALALFLAEELGGELINADALQVYRGFDIGTAKPTVEEQALVPHHLIDILDPHERFSAGEFSRRARAAIRDIEERSRRPIVVGGSGLYLRALVEGISPIPPGDPEVRAELEQELEERGSEALHAELARSDPATAAKVGATDKQRILRALEVARVTGDPLSAWIARRPFGEDRLRVVKIGLTLPRALLYDRIGCRASKMLSEGWLDEVERLLNSGLAPSLPAFQAIGYRQLVRHLREGWALESAIEDLVRATRRFAKRQMTWFRTDAEIEWFDSQEPQQNSRFLKFLQQYGSGGAQNA